VTSRPRPRVSRRREDADRGLCPTPRSRLGRPHLVSAVAPAFGAWQKGLLREFVLPTPAEAQRFSRLLTAWNAASDLDDETFRKLFIHGLDIAPATLRRLRQAAAGAAQAETMGQMIQASYPLTAAIKDIGADRWDRMLAGLESQGENVIMVPPTSALLAHIGGDQKANADTPEPIQVAQLYFTDHAWDRIIERGFTPSQVIDAINNGSRTVQKNGNIMCKGSGCIVIINPSGGLVTIMR